MNRFVHTLVLFLVACIAFAGAATANNTVKVKSYTKQDGTIVKGYSRIKTDDDGNTLKVKGYTKADGTKVAAYSRKKTVKKDGTVKVKEKAKVK